MPGFSDSRHAQPESRCENHLIFRHELAGSNPVSLTVPPCIRVPRIPLYPGRFSAMFRGSSCLYRRKPLATCWRFWAASSRRNQVDSWLSMVSGCRGNGALRGAGRSLAQRCVAERRCAVNSPHGFGRVPVRPVPRRHRETAGLPAAHTIHPPRPVPRGDRWR